MKQEKLDRVIVQRAATEVLRLLPKLEAAKQHAPTLFTAAQAVKRAFDLFGDVQTKFEEAQREAEITKNGRIGEIDYELKQAELKAARARAAAEDEYNRTVNNARALFGTKLQALQAAVDAYDAARTKLRKLGLQNDEAAE